MAHHGSFGTTYIFCSVCFCFSDVPVRIASWLLNSEELWFATCSPPKLLSRPCRTIVLQSDAALGVVFGPGGSGVFVSKKRNKRVDTNDFHVELATSKSNCSCVTAFLNVWVLQKKMGLDDVPCWCSEWLILSGKPLQFLFFRLLWTMEQQESLLLYGYLKTFVIHNCWSSHCLLGSPSNVDTSSKWWCSQDFSSISGPLRSYLFPGKMVAKPHCSSLFNIARETYHLVNKHGYWRWTIYRWFHFPTQNSVIFQFSM